MKYCFDCDDTLYNLQEPFLKTMSEILPDIKNINMTEFYQTYRKYGDIVYDKLHKGLITVDDSGIYRAYKACEQYNIEMSLEQACDFQEAYANFQKEIRLSDTYRDYFKNTDSEIAILTNGEDGHQRMKLQALGVFDYFSKDHVFTSGEIGYAKPDRRAFELVCSKMDTKTSDWYYIGDNYINDMQGAKNAGMKTIHLNRHHALEGPCSDYVVYSEEELIELLRKLDK